MNAAVSATTATTTMPMGLADMAAFNRHWAAVIAVVVRDNGGTANGGIDAITNTFTVTVLSVNDTPTLNPLPNLFINENSPQQTVNLTGLSSGVRFGFGTDSGGASERYFIQGFYEHRQMELLVQAGLTPMRIIQSFSKNNSEMLGIDKDFGTLAKGKAADLLVLAKNPLDDIANMRTFESVYLGGKKFE